MVGLFEQRALGFIDILGFKKLIEEAETSDAGFQRLAGLKAVLDAHVRFDNDGIAQTVPEELKPRYIFISDNIILSAPLLHGHNRLADGLAIVVLKAIQIAQKIIELGHLVRGGIAVGNVWHDAHNIFGSGYIDAYQVEQRTNHPRVMLSPNAANIWRTPGRVESTLCIPDGGDLIVDVLHTYYLTALPYEPYFYKFRTHIDDRLRHLPLGSPERAKWEWMVGFFNDAIARHSLNVQTFNSLQDPEPGLTG